MPTASTPVLVKSTFGKACYVDVKRLPTELSTDPKSLRPQGISCARVALDVPLATLFDYALPDGVEIQAGDRVTLPFGAKQRIGVVLEIAPASELPVARLKRISA